MKNSKNYTNILKKLFIGVLISFSFISNNVYAKELTDNINVYEELDSTMFFEDGDLIEITNLNSKDEIRVSKFYKIGLRNIPGCLPGAPGYPICGRITPTYDYSEYKPGPLVQWIGCVTNKTVGDLGLDLTLRTSLSVFARAFERGGKKVLANQIASVIPVFNKAYWTLVHHVY